MKILVINGGSSSIKYQLIDMITNVVMAKGGKVETIDFLPGYSTSAIEAKIRNT